MIKFSTVACAILALSIGAASAAAPVVSLIADPAMGAPAKHGFDQLAAALTETHVPFETVGSLDAAQGRYLLVAALARGHGPGAPLVARFQQPVPTNAESLEIQKLDYKGHAAWVIAGADDRGLMYAALDVAQRIRWAANPVEPLAQLRDTVEKPDLAARGILVFTMNRAYWESRFYDEAYWQRYLDTLAQNRFNSLAIIFGYENGGFLAPCYPYFFDGPEFPTVKMIGITPAEQKKNTDAMTRLIAQAHARGIGVTLGIWDHIYRGGVQNGASPGGDSTLGQPTTNLVWGVTGENVIPYTQAALRQFLKTFPDIDGISFRMHNESGLTAAEQGPFWKATFQTIREVAPKMPLDLRAKGLTAQEIQSAIDAGVNFRVSTKYWMEQLGLPFPPTHINPGDQANRRHGYADLLVYPRKYQFNWQLWNGGSTRILLWGDPEYTRRLCESTHLYDGLGLEVCEPLATKMESQIQDQQPFDLLKPSARYYDYEFERYWHYFQVWGRMGYDSQTPPETWDREFAGRFGRDAGPLIEQALHQASWIIPRIIASCYPYTGFPMTSDWVEKMRMGDLAQYARATLSDVQLFENFDDEAQLLLDGGETPKTRPEETSRWLTQTASDVRALIAVADAKIGPRRSKEYDSTVLDLKIISDLALYYARRIPAAVSYRLFAKTSDTAAFDDALSYEREAVAAWRQIVTDAGDTYASDLMMGSRSRGLSGHWKDELAALERDLTRLQAQRNAASATASRPAPRYVAFTNQMEVPAIECQPVLSAPALQPLTIRAHVTATAGVKWVQALYRSVNQTKDYETLELKAVNDKGDYEGVIPGEKLNPRFDFMYLIQAMDKQRHGVMYPDFTFQTPYFVVPLKR